MKKCEQCGDEFPIKLEIAGKVRNLCKRKFCLKCSPFGEHNTSKNGYSEDRGRKSARRKKQQSEQVTRWRQQAKLKLIEYKGGKCQRCGYNKPIPRAYAFHHRDPKQKDFGIAEFGRAFSVLMEEADKCDLLCVLCHAEVHHELDSPVFQLVGKPAVNRPMLVRVQLGELGDLTC